MEKIIRTGLENQEKKVVNYLFREGYSERDILGTCRDPVLNLSMEYVKGAIKERRKRKDTIRKTLVSIALGSLMASAENLPVQRPQYYEENPIMKRQEIPSNLSEYISEDNYRLRQEIPSNLSEYISEDNYRLRQEIPSNLSEYISEDNYRLKDWETLKKIIDKEYSDEEIRENMINSIESLME